VGVNSGPKKEREEREEKVGENLIRVERDSGFASRSGQ